MYDTGKIIVGLAIFVVLFTSPIAYNLSVGDEVNEPVLSETAKAAGECVRDTEWMTENHMKLLNEWRDIVVRDGYRVYVSPDNGKEYNMSLTNTCMDCHADGATMAGYQQFCNACHTSASVEPYCWKCHLQSKDFDEILELRELEEFSHE